LFPTHPQTHRWGAIRSGKRENPVCEIRESEIGSAAAGGIYKFPLPVVVVRQDASRGSFETGGLGPGIPRLRSTQDRKEIPTPPPRRVLLTNQHRVGHLGDQF